MQRLNYGHILIHVLLWLVFGFLTFTWLASGPLSYDQSIWFTFRTLSLHAALFYINLYVLLPRLMAKNHIWAYSGSIILLIVLIYFLRKWSGEWIASLLQEGVENGLERGVRGGLRNRPRLGFLNGRLFIETITSLAVLFVSTAYWVVQQNRKREKQAAQLARENLENELKLLKNQINPHFLFNALNNLYSLTITQSDNAPEMLMKLSEMMRYVLYESNESTVPLSGEIDYIRHYIDFQRIKSEDNSSIKVGLDVHPDDIQVAPMLFIPFIENAFKHGNPDSKDGYIEISMQVQNNEIIFSAINSVSLDQGSKDDSKGIGIENVKKRLSLLYPDKYVLITGQKGNEYSVQLTITL